MHGFCDIPELTLPVCDLPGVVMLYSSLELYQDWSWLNTISYLWLVYGDLDSYFLTSALQYNLVLRQVMGLFSSV